MERRRLRVVALNLKIVDVVDVLGDLEFGRRPALFGGARGRRDAFLGKELEPRRQRRRGNRLLAPRRQIEHRNRLVPLALHRCVLARAALVQRTLGELHVEPQRRVHKLLECLDLLVCGALGQILLVLEELCSGTHADFHRAAERNHGLDAHCGEVARVCGPQLCAVDIHVRRVHGLAEIVVHIINPDVHRRARVHLLLRLPETELLKRLLGQRRNIHRRQVRRCETIVRKNTNVLCIPAVVEAQEVGQQRLAAPGHNEKLRINIGKRVWRLEVEPNVAAEHIVHTHVAADHTDADHRAVRRMRNVLCSGGRAEVRQKVLQLLRDRRGWEVVHGRNRHKEIGKHVLGRAALEELKVERGHTGHW
eukprot:comp21062_c0_seq1/m.44309 comp21062_c0_seq1/g.44309  ORF comp21062_c0_seq1/g.44309 comp21062_c0_seq1/m.44309 type:complete len:364 (-) comp21062_c0_seq1:112-1203(-)